MYYLSNSNCHVTILILGNNVKVILKPGEMVLYESAKVLHGRQHPLDGQYFDNVFIHFTWKNPKFQAVKQELRQKFPFRGITFH